MAQNTRPKASKPSHQAMLGAPDSEHLPNSPEPRGRTGCTTDPVGFQADHQRNTPRSPNGIRTRVSTLRGWCPWPLDDGAVTRLFGRDRTGCVIVRILVR